MYGYTVEFFRSLDIPVRTLECCSGDLADLKVKSLDVEAWSPRQKKYFEVGSCSNLGDAQARRLSIRIKGKDGSKYFAHTLNNTVVAPPLHVEILFNEFQYVPAFAVSSILVLMAIVILVIRSLIEHRGKKETGGDSDLWNVSVSGYSSAAHEACRMALHRA